MNQAATALLCKLYYAPFNLIEFIIVEETITFKMQGLN